MSPPWFDPTSPGGRTFLSLPDALSTNRTSPTGPVSTRELSMIQANLGGRAFFAVRRIVRH